MTFKIRPKRSGTAGKVPVANQLDTGEIALNMVDKIMFFKDASGAVQQLAAPVPQQPTNISVAPSAGQVNINSSTGAGAVLSGATPTQAGIMTDAHVTALNNATADIKENADNHHSLSEGVSDLSDELVVFSKEFDAVHKVLSDLRDLIKQIPTAPSTPPVASKIAIVTATAVGMTGNSTKNITYTSEHESFIDHMWVSVTGTGPLKFDISITNAPNFELSRAAITAAVYRTPGTTNKFTTDGSYNRCSLVNSQAWPSKDVIQVHPTYGTLDRVSLMFAYTKK